MVGRYPVGPIGLLREPSVFPPTRIARRNRSLFFPRSILHEQFRLQLAPHDGDWRSD